MALPNLVNHLDTTDMPATGVWREIPSNSRDKLLSNNNNKTVDVDTTAGGTIVLSINEREENQLINLIGTPGAGYTIEFADGDKQITIENNSGQTATIETTTGAATPATVLDGDTAILHIRGTDITVAGIVSLIDGALLHGGQVDPTALINFANKKIAQACFVDYAIEVTSPSSSGGNLTLDLDNGNWFDVTLTEAITGLFFTNPPATTFNIQLEDGSGSLVLEDGSGFLIGEGSDAVANIVFFANQDSGGGHTIAWPANVVWEQATGSSPSLTLDALAVSIYWFFTTGVGLTINLQLEDGSGNLLLEDVGGNLIQEASGDQWYGMVLGLNMS